MFAQLAVMAMLFELAVGYPQPVYRAIGHPVTWIGGLIALFDAKLNRPEMTSWRRRLAGVAALVLLVALTGAVAAAVQVLLGPGIGLVATAILASTLIAQRSLGRHVRDVADALEGQGIEAGRKAVSQIVGRDTAVLDEAGVSRAAIESLAENFSDGVTAPDRLVVLAAVVAFGALGFVDDVLGDDRDKGLKGHVAAALKGRVTTGFVKMAGGASPRRASMVSCGCPSLRRVTRVCASAPGSRRRTWSS